jgi:hypothetical protein
VDRHSSYRPVLVINGTLALESMQLVSLLEGPLLLMDSDGSNRVIPTASAGIDPRWQESPKPKGTFLQPTATTA